ncbi:MAG TPA: hypothetical protein VME17_09915 [Bryobacteraceae bacterium]|nr:hypothetical protein [Bryobacteraceae bacterium]
MIMVSDGSVIWMYLSQANQYGAIPLRSLTADAPGDLGDARPEAMDDFVMHRYRMATFNASGALFVREEPVTHEGANVNCHVVSVLRGAYTWWIDARRYIILREDHAETRTVFTTIKLGETLPAALFEFSPPAGATKMDIAR